MRLADGLLARLQASPRAGLLVEIALLAPALALFGACGFEWGGYLWLQSRVQSAAESALSAALATRDPARRLAVARTVAEHRLAGRLADLSLDSAAGLATLSLAYDASRSPVFAAADLLPLPSPVILGRASRRR